MLGILLAALFAFGFGGTLLILMLGAKRVAREIATTETDGAGGPPEPSPPFFARNLSPDRRREPPDRAFLSRLQRYLQSEQSLADAFVAQPSIESLYRDSHKRFVE